MEAADLDADGDLELVMINDAGICILENLGSGSFAPAVCFGGQAPLPTALAIGDVNGDSAPDIVVTRGTIYTIYSYLNDGNLGFASFVTSPGSFTLQGDIGIALGDLNLDGRLDAGVVNVSTFNVRHTSLPGSSRQRGGLSAVRYDGSCIL